MFKGRCFNEWTWLALTKVISWLFKIGGKWGKLTLDKK